MESCFNNEGIDESEGSVEKGETIGWPSIFGGTSIYWGILWGDPESLIWLLTGGNHKEQGDSLWLWSSGCLPADLSRKGIQDIRLTITDCILRLKPKIWFNEYSNFQMRQTRQSQFDPAFGLLKTNCIFEAFHQEAGPFSIWDPTGLEPLGTTFSLHSANNLLCLYYRLC